LNASADFQPLPAPQILLHDGPCIVVFKPGGLLTQGPPGVDSMEMRVRQYLRQRENKAGKIYLGVPHRLDRPAAGVMVFARHVRAAQRIAAQFEKRTVVKKYWALVDGNIEPEEGTWVDFMRKIPDRPQSEIVDENTAGAQRAVLHYQVKQRTDGMTWIEIELETGRTHQIRLQAASRGHSIIGDSLYGNEQPFGPQTSDQRQRWIALLARRLKLRHPTEDKIVDIHAPIPDCWQQFDFFDFSSAS
jgi:23S rRNA pseudouridine1911/1915/1917 synthase